VQTFLPLPDVLASAAVLDQRRLGKQRVEALQVLRALRIEGYGWRNHPAVRMWRGYAPALACYGVTVCRVWRARGFADTCAPKLEHELDLLVGPGSLPTTADLGAGVALPPWFGDVAFHRSHQSALVRKDPGHYRAFFPDVPDDLDYVWPAP
jgi:hypothetical protein